MKKTIRLSIITLICVLMMFQPCVVNAQASVTDAEKIATQTDAQEQSCRAGDGTSIPDGHPDNGYGQVCDCWRRSATKKECIVSLAGV